MATSSELGCLYEAAFGRAPSAKTMTLLLRMETFCGLSQDDPLARMLVLQLRVADHVAEAHREREGKDKEQLDELRQLTDDFKNLLIKASVSASQHQRSESQASRP